MLPDPAGHRCRANRRCRHRTVPHGAGRPDLWYTWAMRRAVLAPAGLTLLVAVLLSAVGRTADTRPAGPQPPDHATRLEALLARCDAALREDPEAAEILQRRAETLFRLGRINDSVRDFDRVVELAPDAMPHNWQRGIALYYAGRFSDGAKQFERHRAVNPQDVENAAFHFVCLARALGPDRGPAEAARQLIPIERDARVPLMKVHAMYAGTATPDDVLAEARKGDPAPAELRERLFYGHLYIALWHDAFGRSAEAAKHARLAAGEFAVDGYMGDVARVHAWLAETRRLPATGPATTGPATRPVGG